MAELEKTAAEPEKPAIDFGSPEAYVNRELSWLQFARRVLCLVEDPDVPLLERVKFAGIMGMLHDEFVMKRLSGMKRQTAKQSPKLSLDGHTPREEFLLCREELLSQSGILAQVFEKEIRPALEAAGIPIWDHIGLDEAERVSLRGFFQDSVLPILTPLAVDAAHPFPFISNLGLNLALELKDGRRDRFVRIKVPANRSRWVPLKENPGFVPLEQVIAANLDLLFPNVKIEPACFFRVTRGAEGDPDQRGDMDDSEAARMPGAIIRWVTNELKARRFAGAVRLQVSSGMPDGLRGWLATQLHLEPEDVYASDTFLGIVDLLRFQISDRDELRDPRHEPVTHPRLRKLDPADPGGIFDEIRRGEILLHHPYHSFNTSVLRFLEFAAADPKVLAIKLTLYRTSGDSPIITALQEAARRGKQVAVLVEITARFDEAPNIAWGRALENEGVHVAYGVEKLKTHVKLAMVVREEEDGIHRYVHVGTGNYHTITARVYEDLGILSANAELSADVAAVFNELTSATPSQGYRKMIVAPRTMRDYFTRLIRTEANNASAGLPAGIRAKMNQLQDPKIIQELYLAGRAGVPVSLNVRGLCCLRPGVPGLSETIRVYSVIGRFLEHGRIYRFENAGDPIYLVGSADWMRRNLDQRVETIMPVENAKTKKELEQILSVYENDNYSAWDMQPDGTYIRRRPEADVEPLPSQSTFIRMASRK
jgi:polyphosphate kinase